MKKIITLFFVVFCFQIAKADPTYEGLFTILISFIFIIWAVFWTVCSYIYVYKTRKKTKNQNIFYVFVGGCILSIILYLYTLYYVEDKFYNQIYYIISTFIVINLPIIIPHAKNFWINYKIRKKQKENYLEKPINKDINL